jgi:hypothetical protein
MDKSFGERNVKYFQKYKLDKDKLEDKKKYEKTKNNKSTGPSHKLFRTYSKSYFKKNMNTENVNEYIKPFIDTSEVWGDVRPYKSKLFTYKN